MSGTAALAVVVALATSGCGLVAFSPYRSEQESVDFLEECAKLDEPELREAERASILVGLVVGMGRFGPAGGWCRSSWKQHDRVTSMPDSPSCNP